MKNDALIVVAIAACALITSAQEPRVTHTQFHSGPASLGLSATVDRFRHSNASLWLGYAVPALPRKHYSPCSAGAGSSQVEDGCCGEVELEDRADDLNAPASLLSLSMCFCGWTMARLRKRARFLWGALLMPEEWRSSG
jgi:hypothetical protein